MLKRLSFFVLAAIMATSFAYAASTPTAEGTIQKINKDSITIQVGSEEKTFTFEPGLKMTVNGKREGKLTVKAGDKAKIYANKKNVAKKIDITPQTASVSGSSN